MLHLNLFFKRMHIGGGGSSLLCNAYSKDASGEKMILIKKKSCVVYSLGKRTIHLNKFHNKTARRVLILNSRILEYDHVDFKELIIAS